MTRRSKRKGFTLIELVVVLSIMVILATLGIVGYQSSFPPGVISAARNEIHGMLRFARQQAITQGSNSILIVNYEKADTEKFLRYVGVIAEDEYNSGNWNAAHSGVYLPEGVFFVPQIVDGATDGFSFDAAWPADGADPPPGYLPNSMPQFEFPGADAPYWSGVQGSSIDLLGHNEDASIENNIPLYRGGES